MHEELDSNVQLSLSTQPECYDALPLVELASRISNQRDRLALKELHDNRPVFRLVGGRPLLFVQFISVLRETPWAMRTAGHSAAVLDRACDIVTDRFSNLPPENQSPTTEGKAGPDCRYYFRAFLQVWENWKRDKPSMSPLQDETASARILQRGVIKHFRLSCLEARRECNPARSRYAWQIGAGTIQVWMPASLPGRDRRAWLETHVDDPDSSRPQERDRVQQIVDEFFGIARRVPINSDVRQIPSQDPGGVPLASLAAKDGGVFDLAAVIADEKVARIRELRPAIQALGKANLRKLVIFIIEALSEDRYEESQVARDFGLSKSTVSRFAGIRWEFPGRIPDLWANVAHTLASHAPFIETAQDAGVWDQVQRVLGNQRQANARRTGDV